MDEIIEEFGSVKDEVMSQGEWSILKNSTSESSVEETLRKNLEEDLFYEY